MMKFSLNGMNPEKKHRLGAAAALVLIFAAGFAVYSNSLRNNLVWDDSAYLTPDSFVCQPSNLKAALDPAHLWKVLPVANSARPVWMASVLLDAYFGGCSSFNLRLTGVLINCFNSMLLFCLVWVLSGELLPAFLAGFFFALHPIHAEAVNIVTFRGHLLAAFFSLLSVLAFIVSRRTAAGASLAWKIFSAVSMALAFLSHETAAVLPCLMLAADYFQAPRSAVSGAGEKVRLLNHVHLWILLLIFLWFRMPRSGYDFGGTKDAFTRARESPSWSLVSPPQAGAPVVKNYLDKPGPPPWDAVYHSPALNLLTMSGVFGSYLRKLIIPYPLQADYNPPVISSFADIRPWLSWLAWAALLISAAASRGKAPLASLGIIWTAVCLLPACNIISIYNIQAERYLYISSAGICIALAALFSRYRSGKSCRRVFFAAIPAYAAFFAVTTFSRNRDYADEMRLLASTERVSPGIPRVGAGLAALYAGSGRAGQAEELLRKGLESHPDALELRLPLCKLLLDTGRASEGEKVLEPLLRQPYSHMQINLHHAMVRWEKGERKQALAILEKSLQTDRNHIPSIVLLGKYAVTLKQPDVFLGILDESAAALLPSRAVCYAVLAHGIKRETARAEGLSKLLDSTALADCNMAAQKLHLNFRTDVNASGRDPGPPLGQR